MTENKFIFGVNFTRKSVDHRLPYDFNYALNQSQLSRPWLKAAKTRFVGQMIRGWGLNFSALAICGAVVLAFADAYYRDAYYPPSQGSRFFNPGENLGEKFVFNHKNVRKDTGKWNHLFSCWEKDANCGRDFDWVKK